MKMRMLSWILCAALLLTPVMSMADNGNNQIGSYLLEQYSRFTGDERTKHVDLVLVFFDEGMHAFVLPEHMDAFIQTVTEEYGLTSGGAMAAPLMYRDDPQEKRLLTDAARSTTYTNYTSRWNAYDAGEYANYGIAELYRMGSVSGEEGRLPVNADIYVGLLGEITQLVGIDSAYMTGTMPAEDGEEIRWDVLPFILLDPDENVLDESIYLYCRMVRKDEIGDTVVFEYFMAEREAVCRMMNHLLNQNKEISRSEREMMLSYIEYCESMKN